MRNRVGPSRRAFLGAALGGPLVVGPALAGCALFDRGPRFQPGRDVLDDVREDALALAVRYDAAIAARPDLAARLTPLRDAHRAHAAAIGLELGRASAPPGTNRLPAPSGSASGPATPSPVGSAVPDEPLAGLVVAERAAAEHATAACADVAGFRAPLLGSIAACRASHVEALV